MTLNTAWFLLLAFMLAGYAVLDGFDLGVGIVHLLLGRTREERTQLIDSIGPVWNGNEVWLLGAGGALVAAFPTLYAASFSGFYLALMLVLWLLLLRGLGIEFRHQIHHPLWEDAWDVVFSGASALLALLFGVALGNVLRGVPFDADGDFRGTFALLLNGFALLGGAFGVATLAMHGSCWVALKTGGPLQLRARRFASTWWWASALLLVAMVGASFLARPDFTRNFTAHVWLAIVPLLTIASFAAARLWIGRGDDGRAFLASCGYIAGILASVAAGLYPTLLPALPGSSHPGLDIYNAAAPHGSLRTALVIYLFGLAIVSVYLVNIYRVWRGKSGAVYDTGASH
jgi:cytochrome d ubiquinol oxidase subunit II